MQGAPKLDMDNLTQVAALPLNSRLKIDPWDDKVFMLHVKPAPLLNARDKMPLEITPVYFRLERYQQTPPAAEHRPGQRQPRGLQRRRRPTPIRSSRRPAPRRSRRRRHSNLEEGFASQAERFRRANRTPRCCGLDRVLRIMRWKLAEARTCLTGDRNVVRKIGLLVFLLFPVLLSLRIRNQPSVERLRLWAGGGMSTFNPDWGCTTTSPFCAQSAHRTHSLCRP